MLRISSAPKGRRWVAWGANPYGYTHLAAARGLSCFKGKDEISGALEADPDHLGSWRPIAGARQISSQTSHQDQHFKETGRLQGRWLPLADQIDSLPFLGRESHLTGHVGYHPSQPGQIQHTPSHNQVQGQGHLDPLAGLQLQLLDLAPALQDPEEHLDLPAAEIPLHLLAGVFEALHGQMSTGRQISPLPLR